MAVSRASVPHPHTLAQFARRAGISEGRARALLSDGKLPAPDGTDADGRPLWGDTTVDAWCQTTNRPVQDEALWIFRVPPVTEPASEMFHGLADIQDGWGRAHQVHAIVWDTPHGHIVYVMPLVGDALEDYAVAKRHLARAGLQLVQPAFWVDTLVCTFSAVDLPYLNGEDVYRNYNFDVFRLTPAEPQEPSRRPRRLRLFGQAPDPASVSAQVPHGEVGEGTIITAPTVARAIGRPVPLWVAGTCTPDAVRRARAYQGTVTVPDTVTDWPSARDALERAQAWGMRESHPAAFAALAADTMQTLHQVQRQLRLLADTGEGWQLAARPAAPDVPFPLERALAAPAPELSRENVVAELHELHTIERNLPHDDLHGDAIERAVESLAYTVAEEQPDAIPERIFPYAWTCKGPIADLLTDHLTPVPAWGENADGTRPPMPRRVRRLVKARGEDRVRAAFTDSHGRYVLSVAPLHDQDPPEFLAEWPTAVPEGWNQDTVIAADDSDSTAGVFALTPRPDGGMTVDPVPFDPHSGPSFAYGYSGGSPWTLYTALLRCAAPPGTSHTRIQQTSSQDSQLWKAITSTTGSLRLSWPQVCQWAKDDVPPH